MTPQRIQRRRTKGWRQPANAVIVTRPGKYGNPYTFRPVGDGWKVYEWNEEICETPSRAAALDYCLQFYRKWVEVQVAADPYWLEPLRGHDLCCWCKEGDACHADLLLELANKD